MSDKSTGPDAAREVRLPHRPRLADHVMMRRQVIGGVAQPQLIDSRTGRVFDLTDRELDQLLCLDGTRDIGGVLLAAVQRGAYHRASEIQELLGQLQEANLLVDGIAPPKPPIARHPERALEALPGFRMHCAALGSCCTTFASAPFSHDEMVRASQVAGDRLPGPGDRVFLPLWGSVDRSIVVVSMQDGQCPFLVDDTDDGALCSIHQRADADAKPEGCRIYPRTYTDDGDAVRVSVRVECACVMLSAVAEHTSASALVSASETTEADLSSRVRVVRLPPEIALARGKTVSRSALRSWSSAVCEGAIQDGVAACWQLANAVDAHGLDVEAARRALADDTPPAADALQSHLRALAATAAARRETAANRTARDRVRVLSDWADMAAQALLNAENLLLEPTEPAREAFYLRATVWGHGLVQGPLPLADALRDRGIRLLLARQMGHSKPPAAQQDVAAAYPITAMETMMRAQSLERYVDSL